MSDESDLIFTPHSAKQEDLIFSDADLTIAGTGTQWGKSNAGALWMQRQAFTFTDPKDNFIVAAPTYKIMEQSIIPYFLYYMSGWGNYSKADGVFKVANGGTVYFRTETDPDSIVGIPNVKAGWLDEAGKLRLYFWENYQARAASRGAKTLLTTSPYSLNWLYKNYIKPITSGKELPGVKLFQASSWENPYHSLADVEKRNAMRAQMDPRRFDMVFGGQWGKMIGLVYDCWDEDVNIVNPFELPGGTKYYAGVDWGYYPDPFAMTIRAITPDNKHYCISEFVKNGLTITDIARVAKQKMDLFPITAFYCDPSQPGYIEELGRNGVPAVASDNDIRRGIDLHYELIKTRKYRMFKNAAPYMIDEMENYHYPELPDLKPDQSSKELNPVDKDNHVLDAERYITLSTYRSDHKIVPKTPGDQKRFAHPSDRLEFLKKASRNRQSERFS